MVYVDTNDEPEMPVTTSSSSQLPSVTVTATAMRMPFVRCDLTSSNIAMAAMPMPNEMVRRHVPMQSWNDFWLKVKPIVRNVEKYDSLFNTMLIALTIVAIILILLFIVVETEGELVNFIYWAMVMIALFGLFAVISGRTRAAQLEQLRSLCRDEQDGVFGSYGYALECEFEWGIVGNNGVTNGQNTHGFRLYFLPSATTNAAAPTTIPTLTNGSRLENNDFQNGYLRISLFNAGTCGCAWTPFSLSYLALFNVLPIGFESLDAWPSFWAEMTEMSAKCLLAYRLQVVTQCSYVVIILIMIVLADTTTDRTVHSAVLFLFLIAIVAFFIVSCRFTSLMNARSYLVQQCANRFAQQGVYMEYRTMYRFQKYSGMYSVHYLYLFPSQSEMAAVSSTDGHSTSIPDTTIV
jgi:hypothetical protein